MEFVPRHPKLYIIENFYESLSGSTLNISLKIFGKGKYGNYHNRPYLLKYSNTQILLILVDTISFLYIDNIKTNKSTIKQ